MLISFGAKIKSALERGFKPYFSILKVAASVAHLNRKVSEFLCDNPDVDTKRELLDEIELLRFEVPEEKIPLSAKTKLAYLDSLRGLLGNLVDMLGKWGALFSREEIGWAMIGEEFRKHWLDQFESNMHYHRVGMNKATDLHRTISRLWSIIPNDRGLAVLTAWFFTIVTAFKHLAHFAELAKINLERAAKGIQPESLEVNEGTALEALERADQVANNLGMQLNLVGLFEEILGEMKGTSSERTGQQ